MTDREERLEEALRRIAQWADAYPLTVFHALRYRGRRQDREGGSR